MSDLREDMMREYADAAAERVCAEVIEAMKGYNEGLSGKDSGLANAWEEICVQVQGEHSAFWNVYLETMHPHVVSAVEALPEGDRRALWLQTDTGSEWFEEAVPVDADGHRDGSIPYDLNHVVEYVSDRILNRAEDFSNPNIERFLSGGKESEEDEGEDDALRDKLVDLMPAGTMVTDMWGWDRHFENESFPDLVEVAFSDGEQRREHTRNLAEYILGWIDDYDIDYAQNGYEPGDFEGLVTVQCEEFMERWRENVKKEFNR